MQLLVMVARLRFIKQHVAGCDVEYCTLEAALTEGVAAVAGTVWGDISTPWPAVLLGAASSAFVVSVLAVEGFRRPWSEDAAQMYYAVSLLSTLVLMAAWMFVNWCGCNTFVRSPDMCALCRIHSYIVITGLCNAGQMSTVPCSAARLSLRSREGIRPG